MKQTYLIAIAAALLAAPAVWAEQPDSVYLFSYANADGRGGLKLAWSADARSWTPIADQTSVVNSDFGPWGSMKRMYRPRLVQDAATGTWHCTWALVDGDDTTLAYASSPDLTTWGPQQYLPAADARRLLPSATTPVAECEARIAGTMQRGVSQRVAWPFVEGLLRYADHRRYRDMLHAETMASDPVRYAALKPFEATLTVYPDSAKAISDKFIGIFFEDINYAADGGLYAELVQNRDFEYSPADGSRQRWDATYAWTSDAPLTVVTDDPIHPNNPHYLKISGASILTNSGFDGISLTEGEKYRFSIALRTPRRLQAEVMLTDSAGTAVASGRLTAKGDKWKKYTLILTPSRTVASGRLSIRFPEGTDAGVDMVSLFPVNTFKGRENGLRADLAQTLADLHPRFVRFPGGCVAHGNGVDNIYDWKGSIGPLEARKPLRNLWGYHQTRGLGYHEYFLFCEDIGAEPLPVVAAGVPCQNSGDKAHHSCSLPTRYGQQEGIPLDEMDAYLADILHLIEYANGDPRTSEWARLRAKAGHPNPCNLKYIGIGNEDMITPVFESRFRMIYDAVAKAYPDITVVGTVGPFYEGTDYREGWRLATELGVPMVDEHYYVSPGWMVNNATFYDAYSRDKSKVYLGEWAAHLPGRPSNVETALAEALYLTNVERNADVVTMTSYAPLLAKDGHTQWRPDLIYFSNTDVRPTVDYYVQQLYGRNPGTSYIASEIASGLAPDAAKRLGASVVTDAATGDLIVRFANLLPVEATVALDGIDTGAYASATLTTLSGRPDATDVRPVEQSLDAVPASLKAAPYSFTLLRLRR